MDQAIALVWRETREQLLHISNRILQDKSQSQDVVSDCFERFVIHFRAGRVHCPKGWLIKVVRHESLKQYRLRYRGESHCSLTFFEEMNDGEEEKVELVMQCLTTIRPAQRRGLELFYLEDKSYREISIELGVSISRVKSIVQNGKRMVIKQLSRRAAG